MKRHARRTGTTGARAGTRGARSSTRDSAGNFHLDYEYSHRGEMDHHIARHDVVEARAPFAGTKGNVARVHQAVRHHRHTDAGWEDANQRKARGDTTHRRKGTWRKGERSKTKDSKGNYHKDAVTHAGDKTYHRGGHDEHHKQGSARKSRPFKSVEEAHKVISKLKGKTNGDAEKLRKLRRAVAYKNHHKRYHK